MLPGAGVVRRGHHRLPDAAGERTGPRPADQPELARGGGHRAHRPCWRRLDRCRGGPIWEGMAPGPKATVRELEIVVPATGASGTPAEGGPAIPGLSAGRAPGVPRLHLFLLVIAVIVATTSLVGV